MEIHETIAECMIFANHWVARRIAEAFPNAALVSNVPILCVYSYWYGDIMLMMISWDMMHLIPVSIWILTKMLHSCFYDVQRT